MFCCVVLYNMVTEEKIPLKELQDGEGREIINGNEKVEHLFQREDMERTCIMTDRIEALYATK